MRLLAILLFVSVVVGCKQDAKQEEKLEVVAEVSNNFGETVELDELKATQWFVDQINSSDSIANVITTIKVKDVCQNKGCWMTAELPDGSEMRVTFKDYGFFVPKDLSGKEVAIQGLAKIKMTDVETLRHYAEDKGKSADEIAAIVEPKKEISFVANGVVIME